MNARGGESAPACSGRDLAEFEMTEELLPFLLGNGTVFLGRSQGPPPGQECQVGLDRLLRVDRLITHCHVDVPVPCDNLRDMRGQAAQNGVGDEYPPEVVGRVMQR